MLQTGYLISITLWTMAIIFLFRSATPIRRVLLFSMHAVFLLANTTASFLVSISGNNFGSATLYHLKEVKFSEVTSLFGYQNMFLGYLFVVLLLASLPILMKHTIKKLPNSTCLIFATFFILISLSMNPLLSRFLTSHFEEPEVSSSLENETGLEDRLILKLQNQKPLGEVEFPNKPNIVFIYAESLEANFFNNSIFPKTKNPLNEMPQLATKFTKIGQAHLTGWTVAGMVASQCGLPLTSDLNGNSFSNLDSIFFSRICLGDILKSQGYELTFLQGSPVSFGGIDKLFLSHGFSEVIGSKELQAQYGDNRQKTPWGYDDALLLDHAYDLFIEKQKASQPFGLFLSTIDTHPPDGHVSIKCTKKEQGEATVQLLRAINCSSTKIKTFIEKILAPEFAKNTIVVVVSDHLMMNNPLKEKLSKKPRYNTAMIFSTGNSKHKPVNDTNGSMLDIPTSLLSFLGVDYSVGLGVDLLSREQSIFDAPSQTQLIGQLSDYISSYHQFPKITDDTYVDFGKNRIVFGDRYYQLPVIMTLGNGLETKPHFESEEPTTLIQHLASIPQNQRFLWIDNCRRIAQSLLNPKVKNEEQMCATLASLDVPGHTIPISPKKPTFISQLFTNYRNGTTNEELAHQRRSNILENQIKEENSSTLPFRDKMKALAKRFFPENIYFWLLVKRYDFAKKSKNAKTPAIFSAQTDRFIAHAGGEVAEKRYSNSLESLDYNYKKGFRYFELDIIETSDEQFVAAHDWKFWSEVTQYQGNLPPTKQVFLSKKLFQKLTPLDMERINQWFETHPDAILVTDKTTKAKKFSSQFKFNTRLMMEIFSFDQLEDALKKNIRMPILNFSLFQKIPGNKIDYMKARGLNAIAMDRNLIEENKGLLRLLGAHNIRVYFFQLNRWVNKDENYAFCNDLKYGYGFYADIWNFKVPRLCSSDG